MAERPILFSGPMVRAILSGQKTQTRRICKPQPINKPLPGDPPDTLIWHQPGGAVRFSPNATAAGVFSPHGDRGDRLWVRETWACLDAKPRLGARLAFRADTDGERARVDAPWRPSIHMPRWASRIDLEIVAVRVERLQNLSRDDARAEGVESLDRYHEHLEFLSSVGGGTGDAEIEVFRSMWNEINGDRATWESNPWCWVVEFKRVQP